ncbi:MAG: polymerase subunit gamma and tau, partial [Gemmatimonadetes bacterium]|nr:polymerase subunit gamma and tau [Gemmatimonadota bacterium]
GAAEMLRALLMVQVGAEPEGLTESTRAMLERYRSQLEPGDILRMLRLLADNETAIRRSGNARLVVETLLLRWAMLDRVVDLQAVLDGALPAPAAQGTRAPEAAPRRASPAGAAPAPAASSVPAAQPGPAPVLERVAFTRDALAAAWGDIVAAARAESPLLGTALAAAEPAEVAPPRVTLRLTDRNAGLALTLERQRERLGTLLARVVGAPVELMVAEADTAAGQPAKRLSAEGLRADRLKGLRVRDPALDAAAEALDLEIVE